MSDKDELENSIKREIKGYNKYLEFSKSYGDIYVICLQTRKKATTMPKLEQ